MMCQIAPRGLLSCAFACALSAGSVSAFEASPAADIAGSETPVAVQQEASSSAASPPARQRLEDAWWTGPVIANSPAPLPPGHFYVESYLFDLKSEGVDSFGSQTYMLYGLNDRWTAGLRPAFGYTHLDDGGGSSHIGVGDLTLHAQYALTTFSPDSHVPAIALAIEETLPTGRYERLDRATNGFGGGAYTTTLGVYAQQYFWLPNGRILRGRINITGSFSNRVAVQDRSVYGTSDGFDGTVRPGAAVFFDNAWEYSLSNHWVLATDFYYRHDAKTSVRDASGVRRARAFDTFAIVPGVEYNWSSQVGVIFGARYIPARGHDSSSITPIVALSVFM